MPKFDDDDVEQGGCRADVIREDDYCVRYTNHAHVLETDHDIQLIFGQLTQSSEGTVEVRQVVDLMMSRSFLPELIDMLQEINALDVKVNQAIGSTH